MVDDDKPWTDDEDEAPNGPRDAGARPEGDTRPDAPHANEPPHTSDEGRADSGAPAEFVTESPQLGDEERPTRGRGIGTEEPEPDDA